MSDEYEWKKNSPEMEAFIEKLQRDTNEDRVDAAKYSLAQLSNHYARGKQERVMYCYCCGKSNAHPRARFTNNYYVGYVQDLESVTKTMGHETPPLCDECDEKLLKERDKQCR
jgi:hypothetical protein